MKRFILSIPDDMLEQLREAAEEHGEMTMAEIARHAIYEYLNAPALTTPLLAGKKTAAPRGGKRTGAGRPTRKSDQNRQDH